MNNSHGSNCNFSRRLNRAPRVLKRDPHSACETNLEGSPFLRNMETYCPFVVVCLVFVKGSVFQERKNWEILLYAVSSEFACTVCLPNVELGAGQEREPSGPLEHTPRFFQWRREKYGCVPTKKNNSQQMVGFSFGLPLKPPLKRVPSKKTAKCVKGVECP